METAITGPIDSPLVRRLVAAQFPEWAELPIRQVLPGGWDNRTFRLGDRMAVRLPSAEAYVAQVDKEQRWLPHLAAGLPLPVPVPLARGRPGEGYPWPWSIYRWLTGGPVDGSEPDMPAIADALGEFLVALHRIEVRDAPPAGPHNFHRGGDLSVYDGETRAALSALSGRVDTAAAERVWTAALETRWSGAPVWVHGDIAPGNLLVQDGRLCAVIDFGSSAVGDPACDLTIAWTLFAGEARETFRSLLRLDAGTWARARGWALWKAVITAAGHDGNQRDADRSWRVIDAVLADHRRSRGG